MPSVTQVAVVLLALCACEAKPERKLEVQKVEVVEHPEREGWLQVRVHTIDGAYVQLDPPFDVPGQGSVSYLSENPKNGVAVFEFPADAMPAGTVEAELLLTHYELRGQRVETKVALTRKPTLVSQRQGPGFSSRLVCGGLDCEVKEGFAASFVIEVRAPEGTKVKVGDASGTVGTSTLKLEPRIGPMLVEVPMGEIESSSSRKTLPLPVELVLADGTTLNGTLEVGTNTVREEAMRALAAAAKGPVEMGADTEAARGKRDTMAYLRLVGSSPTLEAFWGPDTTKLAEVDLVAIQTPAGKRERSCGTYVGPSGEKASFGVTMFDNDVAVFDRRTGKKLAERAFPAPPGQCPSNITRSVGGLSQTSEVSWEVRSAFAKKFIE